LQRNLSIYGPFAAIERVLMALSKAGADRQQMHEKLRQKAMAAWEAVQSGKPNPLVDVISADPVFLAFLTEAKLCELMDASHHLGDAPHRARQFAAELRSTLG
jgi:adenylosuccinate lyase